MITGIRGSNGINEAIRANTAVVSNDPQGTGNVVITTDTSQYFHNMAGASIVEHQIYDLDGDGLLTGIEATRALQSSAAGETLEFVDGEEGITQEETMAFQIFSDDPLGALATSYVANTTGPTATDATRADAARDLAAIQGRHPEITAELLAARVHQPDGTIEVTGDNSAALAVDFLELAPSLSQDFLAPATTTAVGTQNKTYEQYIDDVEADIAGLAPPEADELDNTITDLQAGRVPGEAAGPDPAIRATERTNLGSRLTEFLINRLFDREQSEPGSGESTLPSLMISLFAKAFQNFFSSIFQQR